MTKKRVFRKFPKGLLLNVLDDLDDHDLPPGWANDDFELVENEMTDTSRWAIHHTMTFKELSSGKFYEVSYRVGATEYQDERAFEFEPDMVECYEVEPVEVKTIKFKPVLNNA